jgi:protein tyrosine/serine phosphatase
MDRVIRESRYQHLFRSGIGLLCVVFLCVLGGCATQPAPVGIARPAAWAKPIPDVPGLPNLYQVTPMLYRSAQPSKEGLGFLGEQQPLVSGGRPVKTILSLRAFHDDENIAPASSSVRYEQIRFKTWHPEEEDTVKFLRIVTTPALQPVLVHCEHGSDRTGTMVAVYRIAIQGWSKEAAILEMTQGGYGFHPLWQNLTDYVMQLDVDAIKAAAEKQGSWP